MFKSTSPILSRTSKGPPNRGVKVINSNSEDYSLSAWGKMGNNYNNQGTIMLYKSKNYKQKENHVIP